MAQQTSIDPELDAHAMRLALGRLARMAASLMPGAAVAVALLDSDSGDLLTLGVEGFESGTPRPWRIPLGVSVEGWVGAQQEAVLIDDTQTDARFASTDTEPLRSLLCAPLLREDRLLGTLLVGSLHPWVFDARARGIFLAVAALMAEAVGGIVEGEAQRAHLRDQGVLLETARALAGSLQGGQVLGATVSGLRRVTNCDAALLYWFDAHQEVLRPQADSGKRFSGLLRASVRLGDDSSLAAWVARQRRARAVAPGDEDAADMLEVRAAAEAALLALPLLYRDRLRGVVVLARPVAFTAEELATALSLCGFAACALDNVERYMAARAERAQLAVVFASASDGMAIVDSALSIVDANAAFADLMAHDPRRLVGQTCCAVLRRSIDDRCALCDGACLVAHTLRTGEPIPHRECQLLVPTGVEQSTSGPREPNRYVDFSLTPLTVPDGQRLLLVGRDVTAARTMDQMKAHFLSMVSHELRGPLMAINGYVDLVLSQEGFSDEQRGFLHRARVGSEHLTTLVEDLLLLSRRDAGQLKLSVREINLAPYLREGIEELEILAESAEVALEVDVPDRLPFVRADKDRMQQVVRNLVTNALKFTPAGGVVRVSAAVEADSVALRVRDTGIGIAPEHLSRIFERFYQVEKTTSYGRFPGQGLGLAIVRIIVTGHGGTIAVESAPGQGSTFTVRLPIVAEDE